MPLHCTPVTRRQFLQRTAFGGLAIFTWRSRVQAADVEANRWALFSDTHIAADPADVRRNVNMTDHLRASVAELQSRPKRPVGFIMNGDCPLDAGLPGDYAQFTELLKPIGEMEVPIHFTMGNHDNREVFWKALESQGKLPRPVEGKQISIIEAQQANWFLLDSLEVTKQTPGLLGEEQRAWLTKALDARADKPALIMVHHDVVAKDPTKMTGLKDAEQLFEIVLPRKQVKAIFFGHTHRWEITAREGIHLVNLPAVAYPFGQGQPTGWVDCLLASDRMTLELRAHDTTHAAHGKPVELAWRA